MRASKLINPLSAQNKIYLVAAVMRGAVTRRVTALLQFGFQESSSRHFRHTKHMKNTKQKLRKVLEI